MSVVTVSIHTAGHLDASHDQSLVLAGTRGEVVVVNMSWFWDVFITLVKYSHTEKMETNEMVIF